MQKSVLLPNPLGLLWARFPYQFLRNWNTKLGKIFPRSTLLLPLPRLHLLAMPLLKSLWSDREKRLHINVLELKAVSLALRSFKDQCQYQTVLVATDNSTVVAYINKQGGTHSDVHAAVEDHDMVSSLSHNIKSQTHSRMSECDGRHPVQVEPSAVNRMVTASAGVQTDLPKVVHSSCRSFCHSSEPQISTVHVSSPRPKCLGHRCSNLNWTGLTAYAYPPTALLHRVIQKIRQYHCLIIIIAPGWAGMPWFWT